MGWTGVIRKVYEIDTLLCPSRGGKMKVIAFLTDRAAVDRIINHLKLSFVADRPLPLQAAYQEVLMAAAAEEAHPRTGPAKSGVFWPIGPRPGGR